MRRMRIMGLWLAAMVVTGAASASFASATLPEIGRCKRVEVVLEGKKKVYHGEYKNSSCTKVSSVKRGKYEWSAGTGSADKFTAAGTWAITTGYYPQYPRTSTIGCSVTATNGEYNGPTTLVLSATFTGCERREEKPLSCQEEGLAPGCHEREPPLDSPCQSEGAAAGEIKVSPFEGELGYIARGRKPVVGVKLKPTGGPDVATFHCGSVLGSIQGSMIASIGQVNKMATSFRLLSEGPEAFEGGVAEPLILEYAGKEQPSGAKTKVTITNEEPLEIRG